MAQAAPFHPRTSIRNLPGWIRDAGASGMRIDAGGPGVDFRGLSQRVLIPQVETAGYIASALTTSDLSAADNGYEGISCAVDGYVRDGDTRNARLVYSNGIRDNQIGRRELWSVGRWGTPRREVWIGDVDSTERPDFLDVTFGCRGTGGGFTFTDAQFRYYYMRIRQLPRIGPVYWSGNAFRVEPFPGYTINTASNRAFARFLATWSLSAVRGQRYQLDLSLGIKRSSCYDRTGNGYLRHSVGMVVKFQTSDGQVHFRGTTVAPPTDGVGQDALIVRDERVELSVSGLLPWGIRQVEPILYLNTPGDENNVFPEIDIVDLTATLKIFDSEIGTSLA